MIIQAEQVRRHCVVTGSDRFTLVSGIHARYDDVLQYGGRRYSVVRVERVNADGGCVVLATYRGKL